MPKLAILNDTHSGIRNSSDIFINYQEKFYSECFFPYCLEHGIKKILHAGDYYENRRFINFKALHANRKHFLDKLREYGMTMDIIPGNHDVYYKNHNNLNSLKELLGHYMNEVHIIMKPQVIQYGSLPIAMIPWIAPDIEAEVMEFINNCSAPFALAHLQLEGFDMSKGIPCHDGMHPSVFSRFEKVLTGHFHTKSQQGNIEYLGAQMEFFSNDAHDPKYFHVLDTETRELTPVLNPFTLFEKVYYDDTKENYDNFDVTKFDDKFVKIIVVNKSDPEMLDRFADNIQNRNIHELKIAENFSEFVGENVDDSGLIVSDTETLLRGYIDNVETNLDKDRIKNEIHNLLLRAQSMEIQ